MASRRAAIQDYYRGTPSDRAIQEAVAKTFAAASSDRFGFHGEALEAAVVVRADLNGYGDWSRDRPIGERVALLDDFFTSLVPRIVDHGGVYFRDEGDCIVSLFTDYFPGATLASAERFCFAVSGRSYGSACLTAKTVVAVGNLAFFQKAHERGTEDWSAEGEALVRAARLETAVPSSQLVAFFKDDYEAGFVNTNLATSSYTRSRWFRRNAKVQVEGLGLAGGWSDVVYLEPRGD